MRPIRYAIDLKITTRTGEAEWQEHFELQVLYRDERYIAISDNPEHHEFIGVSKAPRGAALDLLEQIVSQT